MLAPSRILAALFLLSFSAVACVSVDATPSQPSGAAAGGGELSAACQLLAPCCDRWPDDLRRSCSGPAEVKGPEGDSACQALLSNGAAKAYCPELDILDCSAELRAVLGDKCIDRDGGGGTGGDQVKVGLDTFEASNLGKIVPPAGLADVTFGTGTEGVVCAVDDASGQSSCLSGANELVAKRVGDFDVLFAKSIVIAEGAFVELHGTRPVIVVAAERIEVKGMISVGYTTTNLLDDQPRPGVHTTGPGAGTASGGGAFCGAGGGGFDGTGGGKTYGNAELVPLTGGSTGSGSSKAGGAIQLVAGAKIVISGLVNANGQDGFRAPGGSGGAVLVEAPSITGNGSITANGGDGDGNVNTETGGGPGSTSAVVDGKNATVAYAYGGGGAGRIRLDARQSTFVGTTSPAEDTPCTTKGVLR